MKTMDKHMHKGLRGERTTWFDTIMSAIVFAEKGEFRTARELLDNEKRPLFLRRKTDSPALRRIISDECGSAQETRDDS